MRHIMVEKGNNIGENDSQVSCVGQIEEMHGMLH
jgi:hypothetical protein